MKQISWVIIVLVVVTAYWIGAFQGNKKYSDNSQNNSLSLITPTVVSFNQKQQCSDDANRLVNSQQQADDKTWSVAKQFHTGYTTDILKESEFSQEYGTCVAEIDTTIVQDGKAYMSYYVYDTVDNKILAQCPIGDNGSCNKDSFIGAHLPNIKYTENPNSLDWSNYKTLIGL